MNDFTSLDSALWLEERNEGVVLVHARFIFGQDIPLGSTAILSSHKNHPFAWSPPCGIVRVYREIFGNPKILSLLGHD